MSLHGVSLSCPPMLVHLLGIMCEGRHHSSSPQKEALQYALQHTVSLGSADVVMKEQHGRHGERSHHLGLGVRAALPGKPKMMTLHGTLQAALMLLL